MNDYQSEWWRKTLERDPEYRRRSCNKSNAKLTLEFYAEYGSVCVGTCDGEPCQWGVSDIQALTVGHHFNDGAAHRKRVSSGYDAGGTSIMRDLRKRNWPKDEGIVVQCANCQLIDARRDSIIATIRDSIQIGA